MGVVIAIAIVVVLLLLLRKKAAPHMSGSGVQLSVLEAGDETRLPAVCMACGAPATTVQWKQFWAADSAGAPPPPAPPPPDSPLGCLLGLLLFPMMIAHLFSKPNVREV